MSADFDAGVRSYIFGYFVRAGRAPLAAEIARELAQPVTAIQAALHRLHDAHAVVLDPSGELWMVHPFSGVPTVFRVEAADQAWVGELYLGRAGHPRHVETGRLCAHAMRMLRRRDDVDHPQRSAGRQSARRRPFRGARQRLVAGHRFHVKDHAALSGRGARCPLVRHAGQPRGEAFPVEQAWNLAQAWYGDRLEPGYRRRTAKESQALLTQAGLISPFWKLF